MNKLRQRLERLEQANPAGGSDNVLRLIDERIRDLIGPDPNPLDEGDHMLVNEILGWLRK